MHHRRESSPSLNPHPGLPSLEEWPTDVHGLLGRTSPALLLLAVALLALALGVAYTY